MTSGIGTRPQYYVITEATEQYFDRLGDCARGMGWPNEPDAIRRFDVMLGMIRPQSSPVHILDFGCGTGHLYEYLRSCGRYDILYTGFDLSEKFIALAKGKHPEADFRCIDIFDTDTVPGKFDYAIINGAFTSRCSMSFDAMWTHVRKVLISVFSMVRCGLAINTMSKHVDWERDDLFHLPMDTLAAFLCSHLSRHFVMRNDYGLYEYTTCVYRTRS